MSPEQLVGNRSQIGPASDVYSIGATLYDLLARRPPFEASAVLELLSMHGNERPVPLSRLAAHVPKDAEHIVMMCLEHDPADRYATAAELRDDLRAFAKRQPVVGRPVHELRRVIRWIRRLGPVLAAGVVLAGLLLFGFLTRDATLKLEVTNTVAEITLDGEARGATPQTFELASGVHRFRLSATGFAPHESERELAPGGNVEIAKDLQVLPDDKDGLARLSELVGMPAPDVSRVDGTRSVVKGGAAAALVYPAGRIRAVDLRRARFEVYDILEVGEGGDLLIVRTSDGDELFRTTPDLEAGGLRVDIAIPQSVRDALRPGDEVEIAYRIGEQEWKKAATIVAPDPELDTLLARIDERLESQEPWVRAWFRARALLERGFATAALDELRAVVNLDVGAGTQPLVPVVKAVEALKALDAGASALAQEFVVLMESFPDDAKAVWIRRRPGSD
jgi:hypothetical protein